MRSNLLIFLQLLIWSVFGQVQQTISFRKDNHDFGLITERKGKVSYTFYFKNNSASPVMVISAESTCGCTVAEWTKGAVDPGKEGQIKAEYDPTGRPGFFNKIISVMFSPDSVAYTLQIRGQVVGDSEPEALLEHQIGNLKTRSAGFNLGKVYINQEPVSRNFILLNAGSSDLNIKEIHAPEHLKVSNLNKIKAGHSETLSIKFNAQKVKKFGLHTDQLVLITDDSDEPEKHYSVYATVEEYFPVLSPAELEQAPKLSLSVSEIKFPTINQNAVLEREIIFRNTGKNTLKIRSVVPNCSCVVALADSDVLEPGVSGRLKIKFSPAGRTGRQIKSILIYSNDPLHPVQKITLNGLVEDK